MPGIAFSEDEGPVLTASPLLNGDLPSTAWNSAKQLNADDAVSNDKCEVELGVDLDSTKPEIDEKLYRLVTLKNNGLEALLVSNKIESAEEGDEESSSSSASDCSEDDGEESQCSDDGSESNDRDTSSRAAVCVCVGVGSFYDDADCQGLAHFLEHMLFMGSKKYPRENELDNFLAKHGGDSNAFTEGEYTCYYFTVSNTALKAALDIFAQFFISPLFLEDCVNRELNAIESEFRLGSACLETCVREIACMTVKDGHPLGKFTWGNLKTLKDIPEKAGFTALDRLKPFYDRHYVASNMKICIASPKSLDELQRIFSETCSEIRSNPAQDIFNHSPLSLKNFGVPFRGSTSEIESAAKENKPIGDLAITQRVGLNCVFYILPPQVDTHRISMTWQLPSVLHMYKTKPLEYISHLVGHESEGGIFFAAKTRAWATSLVAGVGDDGFENNTGSTIFSVSLTLTRNGVCHWREVVGLVLEYFSFLKSKPAPKWVHDEIASIARMNYMFLDESESVNTVQFHAANMLPQRQIDRIDLLKASFVHESWDPVAVESILDLLSVENMRVDVISSLFDTPCVQKKLSILKENSVNLSVEANIKEEAASISIQSSSLHEASAKGCDESINLCEVNSSIASEADESLFPNNPAFSMLEDIKIEPQFGTAFWVSTIDLATRDAWESACRSAHGVAKDEHSSKSESKFYLPKPNSFVAKDMSIVAFPKTSALHPLVGAFVKMKRKFKRKSEWVYGFVVNYNNLNSCIEIAVEDDIEQSMRFMQLSDEDRTPESFVLGKNELVVFDIGKDKSVKNKSSLVVKKDKARDFSGEPVQCIVLAGAKKRSSLQLLYAAANRLFNFRDGVGFNECAAANLVSSNRMPEIGSCYTPSLFFSNNSVKVWHLQDRGFLRPKAVVYVELQLVQALTGPKSACCTVACDLFLLYVKDLLMDEAYMASMASIEYRLNRSERGIEMVCFGFSDKLLKFVDTVLIHLNDLALKDATIKANKERVHYYRETLFRKYKNCDYKVGRLANSMRVRTLRPQDQAPADLLQALESVVEFSTLSGLASFVRNEILSDVYVEAFCCGNMNGEGCEKLYQLLLARVNCHEPSIENDIGKREKVLKLFPGEKVLVQTNSQDSEERNNVLELYFQMKFETKNEEHNLLIAAIIGMIEELMEEPLYNILRTQRQLGYSVGCSSRRTDGVLGLVVSATSSTHSTEQLEAHILDFLANIFPAYLEELSLEDLECALRARVNYLIENDKNLWELAKAHWDCISDRTSSFHHYVKEGFLLFGISKADILQFYNKWIIPTNAETRIMSIHVTGRGSKPTGSSPDSIVRIPHKIRIVETENNSLAKFHQLKKKRR